LREGRVEIEFAEAGGAEEEEVGVGVPACGAAVGGEDGAAGEGVVACAVGLPFNEAGVGGVEGHGAGGGGGWRPGFGGADVDERFVVVLHVVALCKRLVVARSGYVLGKTYNSREVNDDGNVVLF
jgi:hypothetical protein